MNCYLQLHETTCSNCVSANRCTIWQAMQKKVIDQAMDELIANRPDGTVKAILNKDKDKLIIVAKGGPQVEAIMQLLGEAGTKIIGKRFV